MARPWHDDEITRLREMAAQGLHGAAIADRLAREPSSVHKKVKQLALTLCTPLRAFTDAEIVQLRDLVAQRKRGPEIAEIMGRSLPSVQHKCFALRLRLSPPHDRPFTEAEIETMRRMANSAHAGTAIARALGRPADQVRRKCSALKIRLRPFARESRTRIEVGPEVVMMLEEAAAIRGISPAVLANRLLSVIAFDGLINGVLDDLSETAIKYAKRAQRKQRGLATSNYAPPKAKIEAKSKRKHQPASLPRDVRVQLQVPQLFASVSMN